MRTLNQDLLQQLAEHDAPVCLSLYLEVAAGGGDHKHVRGALKNAQSDAAAALEHLQADPDAVADVRQRLDALDYDALAGASDRRLAIFIAPGLTEFVDANFAQTGVHAGPRFRLAPLIDDLDRTPDHAGLVVTQDKARLYRASGGSLARQTVEGMPGALEEISQYTNMQEKGSIHGREDSGIPGSYRGTRAPGAGASGPQGVPHHSMGGHDWNEDKEAELRTYANQVINAAQQHLAGSNLPLVVAADERLYGMIRENSEYPDLAAEGITLHPRELDEDALRTAASACLEREKATRRGEAWDKIAMSLGRGDREASMDPAEIVGAAAAGRVACLFVRADAMLRGHFDAQALTARVAEDGPEDLIERAISGTLRNRGDVLPLGRRGEAGTVLAAAYRYPA